VLGNKDIPVADGKVSFTVRNDAARADALLGADPSKLQAGEGAHKVTLSTDENGEVTVYFKRSVRVGPNNVEIRAEGLSPVMFIDSTHPGPVQKIEIKPADKHFTTGQEVNFSCLALDGFGNPIPDLDLALALYSRPRDTWEVEDNVGGRTGEAGVFNHVFKMPTRGNSTCKLEIKNKKTGFVTEKTFKVIPGRASSMIFVPSKGTVPAGRKFVLKLRLMDEFDNPIERLRARIVLKESTGGRWILGRHESEVTGEDGSVSLEVTAPPDAGARAVFTAETDAVERGKIVEAVFVTETVEDKAAEKEGIDDLLDIEYGPVSEFSVRAGGEINDDLCDVPSVSRGENAEFPDALSCVDIGAADLSGLPDFSDEDTAASEAFGNKVPSGDEIKLEPIPGGAQALEGLDLDVGPVDVFPSDQKRPDALTIALGSSATTGLGSSLDQLDVMLSMEDAGTGRDRARGGQVAAEDVPVPVVAEPLREVHKLGTEATIEPQGYEGAVISEPEEKDIGFSESTAVGTVPVSKAEVMLDVGAGEITCRAGDILPVKVKVVDSSRKPVSAGVSVLFAIEEPAGAGMDSYFLVPSGIQGEKTYEAEPDLSGEVSSNIQVSSKCGQFKVSVKSQNATGMIKVNVAPGVPSAIRMKASTEKTGPGQPVEIIASVIDKYENPVPGEFVAISLGEYTGSPGVLTKSSGQTDENGQFRVTYRVSANPGDTATITASNPNVGAFAVTPVTIVVAGERQPAAGISKRKTAASETPATDAPLPTIHGIDLPTEPERLEHIDFPPPAEEAVFSRPERFEPPPPQPAPVSRGGRADEPQKDTAPETVQADEGMDEYLEQVSAIQDPYAPPKFNIKRGKKPVMEINRVLPKILIVSGILIGIVMLGIIGLVSYKTVMYKYYYNRGIVKYTADDLAAALSCFEKAIAANEKAVKAMLYIADIYIRQGESASAQKKSSLADHNFNKAIGITSKILQIDPNNTDGYYYEGKAYEGKKSYCKALGSFENIIRINPNDQGASEQAKVYRKYCNEERVMWGSTRRGGTRR